MYQQMSVNGKVVRHFMSIILIFVQTLALSSDM